MAAKGGATKLKAATYPGVKTPFVMGSRPQGLRSPSMQRVKPEGGGTRGYGKDPYPNANVNITSNFTGKE